MHRVVPEDSLKRRLRGGRLSPAESERTVRLANVIAQAEHVWRDHKNARRFLTTPHPELDDRPPIEVAVEDFGARHAEGILDGILHAMPARPLPSRPTGPFTAFRIVDDRYPLLDGSRASRTGGRWSGKGRYVVYAALGFATAMLKKLVRTRIGRIPTGKQFAEILVPGWNDPGYGPSRGYGDAWYDSRRSAVLIVPCHPAMGYERNLLINQLHPSSGRSRRRGRGRSCGTRACSARCLNVAGFGPRQEIGPAGTQRRLESTPATSLPAGSPRAAVPLARHRGPGRAHPAQAPALARGGRRRDPPPPAARRPTASPAPRSR
jgi:RES domain-containing protein